jgi:hypothetical protein
MRFNNTYVFLRNHLKKNFKMQSGAIYCTRWYIFQCKAGITRHVGHARGTSKLGYAPGEQRKRRRSLKREHTPAYHALSVGESNVFDFQ